jgi:PAS domain-containing protein
MNNNGFETRINELELELSNLKSDLIAGKQEETNMAESNLFYSQIINSIAQGVIVYDSKLCCSVWNAYMEKLAGFPASQVLSKYATEEFPFFEEAGVIN